jgi:DNA-binding NtrC family response regulator
MARKCKRTGKHHASGGAADLGGPDRGRGNFHARRAYEGDHIVARAAETAEAVTRSLVGQTVAEVERDLILDTLQHCLGNRTHAANILGISIRTLRNKLNQYSGDGISIPKPGEVRPVA